jgi:signal transduction histidine kinase
MQTQGWNECDDIAHVSTPTPHYLRSDKPPVFFDGLTKSMLAFSAVVVLFEAVNVGGLITQTVVQWLATMVLMCMLTAYGWRLARISALPAIRRFWRVYVYTAVLRALAEGVQAAQVLIAPGVHPELRGAIAQGIYFAAVVWMLSVMVLYPLAADTRRERLRIVLDLMTVMVAIAGVAWFFILAPSLQAPISSKAVITASGQFAIMVIYSNVFRLVLSRACPFGRRTAVLAIVTIVLLMLGEAGPFMVPHSAIHWVLAVRVLGLVAHVFALQTQYYDGVLDYDATYRPKQRPYSVLPYIAIAGLYALLIDALMGSKSVNAGGWGIVIAAVICTMVVVARQLSAFSDNVDLTRQLDDRLRELQESAERERVANVAKQELEVKLRQAQKLEAVGRLAGGVAHELNTPMQYIKDNVTFLGEAIEHLASTVNDYRAGQPEADPQEVDFFIADAPRSVEDVQGGLTRVSDIVRSLKSFGGDGENPHSLVDLNQVIANTVVVARREIDNAADIELELGDVSPVRGDAAELGQVWLNLLINAAHAIEATGVRGVVRVRTRVDGDSVLVEIEDNGSGMSASVAERIFDPFFTTKPVDVGTGQGMTVVRSIVVDGHGGSVDFETHEGEGTTFRVRLPMPTPAPRATFERPTETTPVQA